MRVGIIGYGFMGQWHAEHMKDIAGITVKAAADIDKEKRDRAGAKGLKTYTDYQDLLDDETINTVVIAAPNHLHREMTVAAAQANKNIICEKPAALSVPEFDAMTEAVDKHRVLFAIHQNRRWDADYLAVRKVLAENRLGKVYSTASRLFGANGLVHDWHRKPEYGGGMMYDWGVHLFDQMLDLIPGRVETVFANVGSIINEEVDDYFQAVILFDNGLQYTVELGTYLLRPLPRWYAAGDQGTLVINSFFEDAQLIRSGNLPETLPDSITESKAGPTRAMAKRADDALVTESLPTGRPQWQRYYENYLDALNGKGELAVTNEQVRRVLRLMDAVRQSAALKQSVHFEESFDTAE